MTPEIADFRDLPSPALLVFENRVRANLGEMVRIARQPQRLRPHCKTHKMHAIAARQVAMGISRHKAATVSEVRMLAEAGATDVLLAYQPVGQNPGRLCGLANAHPQTRFSAVFDSPVALEKARRTAVSAGVEIGFFIDLDVGFHRTGIAIGAAAKELVENAVRSPGIHFRGLHVYDGHHRHPDRKNREEAVRKVWEQVSHFRKDLETAGHEIEEIVCGGTPTFPVYSEFDDPKITLSPGTCVLYDNGYGRTFGDISFSHAAWLVTRVVSKPGEGFLTLDLGSKAIAADPPLEGRAWLPELPDCEFLFQSEEHLTLRTPQASRFSVGDAMLALPGHICPSVALHKEALVLDETGHVTDRWPITARDR